MFVVKRSSPAALGGVDAFGSAPASTNAAATLPAAASPQGASTAGSNAPVNLGTVEVTADLDAEREQIAPSLGAVAYKIGPNQIHAAGQGENASFQQILLQAPGVVQDEFGEVHVRGDHGNVQYRLNGVLLPEGLNGFAQAIDPHLINSVSLLTGTLPAQYGDRVAGIFDITTKAGSQLNGNEVSLYGGSYDTIHPSGSFGRTTSNLDYFVTVSYLHNNFGIDNTTASPDPLHNITDQEKVFGYFAYRLDPTSRVTLLLSCVGFRFSNSEHAGADADLHVDKRPAGRFLRSSMRTRTSRIITPFCLIKNPPVIFQVKFRRSAVTRLWISARTECKTCCSMATRRK